METKEIKTGKFNSKFPINKLKIADINRDLTIKHAENFKNKLNNYGWLMPIVVSSSGDIIEGHHRLESAKLLNQKTIPVYIVDWIDTNKKDTHLDCIINLNNGNKAWNKLDYLKAFARENKDYKIVYEAYKSNYNNISVGNVINCFFGKQVLSKFKKGLCKIEDLNFSKYLLNKFSELYKDYGSKKIAAYCVRELIAVAYVKTNKNINEMEELFLRYREMAKINHPAITSISDFRPIMESYLNNYRMKINYNENN